ncbi:MAG TPA: hypothetical protein VER11_05275 [Polyangiaceae bacterium]|nr:hypothetical protein [Polyangiaceae bacterium]
MSYLSPPVQAVIDLFEGPLAEVRFADVDASALLSLARATEAAAADLAQHEAQLSELRQSLADKQDALLLLAQRGLAYARVYAEHDEALSEQLSRINLPKASKPRKATPKPASPEPTGPTVAATPEGEAVAEASTAEAASDTPKLEDAAGEELALEQRPSEEQPAGTKSSSKGKRRAAAPRDEAQSRPD